MSKTINEEIEESKEISMEYVEKLDADLKEQTKKSKEYFEHLQRSMAEFDNFKKRMEKEKQTLYGTITADIVLSILPIIDDFEKALENKCSDEKYKEGIQMIYNSLKTSLKNQGLEEIEALGETFDPILHEAVIHEQDDKYGEKEIIEVLRKGYKISGKVIRHAMVKVAN